MILFLLFIIIVAGLFVFVLTLDVNQYKGLLIEKIEGRIQRDVRIGNISLNLLPRITIAMNGISVKDPDKTWDDILLEAGSVDARLSLLPLLRRDIQIEHLFVRDLNTFLKDDIKLSVTEAVLRNVSLYGPITIDARLSLFGRGKENVTLKALLYPELENKNPYIKNLDLRIDLAKLDLANALGALGKKDIAGQLIGKELSGELAISSERIYLTPEKIPDSDLYLDLFKGAIDALPVKGGLKDIRLKAEMTDGDLVIQNLTGDLAEGIFTAKGAIRDVSKNQRMNLDVKLEGINITRLLPDVGPGKPYLEGRLDMSITSSASGLAMPGLVDTLKAKSTLNLDRAVLKNMNILAVALSKLNMLPGVVERLKSRLPERYKELLKERDTFFKPIEMDLTIENGRLYFQNTEVVSDGFYLVASGYMGINREFSANADLFIPRDLSEAFIGVVREFEYLQDSRGLITMPIGIYGRFPDISVRPDLDYVIQRLAVSKGQELLESIFRKEGSQTPEDEPGLPEGEDQVERKPEKIEPEEVILRTIFDIITGPQDTRKE